MLDEYGEEVTCLDDHKGDCKGSVQNRPSLSGTGTAIPRCDTHWSARLEEQDRINERYPVMQPADFDPSYCGERWDEDY